MPPKVKITNKEIREAGLKLVQKDGANALNARSIATVLNCSTQPIFSNFATMDELQNAITNAAYEHYLSFLKSEAEAGKYPQYKAFGMAYIRFAKDEPELFRLLFMCDRNDKELIPTVDFTTSVEIIMNTNKVTRETAELMHLEMWSCVHGIAVMLATSFVKLEWKLIDNMLSDIYRGLRTTHLPEEKQ